MYRTWRGISTYGTYVSGCRMGLRNVSLDNIHKLASALKVDVSSFF